MLALVEGTCDIFVYAFSVAILRCISLVIRQSYAVVATPRLVKEKDYLDNMLRADRHSNPHLCRLFLSTTAVDPQKRLRNAPRTRGETKILQVYFKRPTLVETIN